MDQNTQESSANLNPEPKPQPQMDSKPIAAAVVVAGLIVAGAILLRGSGSPVMPSPTDNIPIPVAGLDPVSSKDHVLGNANAKVTVIEYADFQCPFCERFFLDSEKVTRDKYVNTGKVRFVYRDFAFLGEESFRAAEASHCAADQGKFWEYHDYLYTHQNGENQGAFADANLKSFAATLGLNTTTFNSCLDNKTHRPDVENSVQLARNAGVNGTPKGFILVNGKVVATIDGAEPSATVTSKIDKALK